MTFHNLPISTLEKILTPESLSEFKEWIKGQTVLIDKYGDPVVYAHDFEKWLYFRWRK